MLTARAENLLHGVDDLDDTITRLRAYRDAGAEVVFAPGLTDSQQIRRLVEAVLIPLNVIASPNGPSIPELAALGVRRVSTGGSLARAAYGAVASAAGELLGPGTSTYLDGVMTCMPWRRRREGHPGRLTRDARSSGPIAGSSVGGDPHREVDHAPIVVLSGRFGSSPGSSPPGRAPRRAAA